MESMLLVGQTDANGALVITEKIYHPRRLVSVKWLAGNFTDGVDAQLINLGLPGAENTLGLTPGALNTTVLTLTDVNDDATYAVNAIVDDTVRLTVSSGGANKTGGCICYFDETAAAGGGSVAVSNAKLITQENWLTSTLSSVVVDTSDVTFTVPANTEYQILSIYLALTTTAVAGNRQMAVQMVDGSGNIIGRVRAGLTQAASLTRNYQFGPGLVQDAAFRDTDYASVSMMPVLLAAGQQLRIYDNKAIDATHDDMILRVQIASRSLV